MLLKEHTLFDDFEYKGCWWLPDAPDKKIGGVISHTAEQGTELLLFGWLGHMPPPIHQDHPEPIVLPVIHGHIEDGTECSLLNVRVAQISWNSKCGLVSTPYWAEFPFFGHHISPDARFVEAKLRFTNLEEWVGHIPFHTMSARTVARGPPNSIRPSLEHRRQVFLGRHGRSRNDRDNVNYPTSGRQQSQATSRRLPGLPRYLGQQWSPPARHL